MRRSARNFIRNTDGVTTLEFVVLFGAFVGIMFFVLEVTLYLFFVATLEKAAEAGVRAAVTSPPAVSGFPTRINGERQGDSCTPDGSACQSFGSFTCVGGQSCNSNFNRIYNRMHGFNNKIEPSNVTITYTDVGIGFAGGPPVPMVTVTVHDVPFQTGVLGLLLAFGGNDGVTLVAKLPTRSASMTGEDLAL